MVATPCAGRSRRLSPTPSPEPSQGPSQASLPMLNETLVMDGNDMEEEEELDQLDVLQSDDRPEEDELATAGDADEVDELEDEAAAAETTPQGPKLAKRTGRTSLSPSPSTGPLANSEDAAVPAPLSPSLTLPSVEAMLDQREEDSAAAAAAAASVAGIPPADTSRAASATAPVNAVASSCRSSDLVADASIPGRNPQQPRFDFFRNKTFFIAGRRPVKSEPAAELDDIRHFIRDAGGSLVKLSEGPTFVVEVGELSATMETRIDALVHTELLSVPAFRKLFGTELKRASKAARRAAQLKASKAAASDEPAAQPERQQNARPASENPNDGGDAMDADEPVPTIEEPSDDAMEKSMDEHRALDVSVETSAGTSATGSAKDSVLFKDKNDLVLIFELQPELASGVKDDLQRLILTHGGQLTTKVSEADIRLVDPTSTKGKAIRLREDAEVSWRCRPWHWVPACVVRGKLLKPDVMDSRVPIFVRKTGGEQLRICAVDELDDREELENLVVANGGRLVDEERADIIVVDEESNDSTMLARIKRIKSSIARPRLGSPSWVHESVAGRQRCQLPSRLAAAEPSPLASAPSSSKQSPPSSQPAAKSAPSTLAASRRRPGRPAGVIVHEYTPNDDRNMVRYMAAVLYHQKTKPPSAGQHIGATGNRIFQDMCAEPEVRPWTLTHTWQSWRNRFMKKRALGFEAALERRMLKLERGNVACPMLDRLQSKRTEKAQPKSAAASRPQRAPSPESEEIEDADEETEAEDGTPRAQAQSTRPAGASRLPQPPPPPRAETVVVQEDDQARHLADVLPPDAGRRSPTIPLDDLLDDDIRIGEMDYVLDVGREVSVPSLIPSPSLAQPAEAAGAAADGIVPVASGAAQQLESAATTSSTARAAASEGLSDTNDNDDDDDDVSDGTGQATQVMHTTLAALAGGALAADADDTESEDDDFVAAKPPAHTSAGPTPPAAPLAPSDGTNVEPSDDDTDAGDGPGGATLAMQALMEHAAEPINSDDSSDDEDLRGRASSVSRPTKAALVARLKTRSPSPLPPARSSREATPISPSSPPPPPPVNREQAVPTGQPQAEEVVHKPPIQTEQPTPLGREKRRLSRPLPRKSLDLPGIGNVPHFDLGGPAHKKPRLSGRAESAASTTLAPRTLSPKEQVIAWAVEMETKYEVDRRRCTPFLQAVYPKFGAAERILFASLPLEDGHVWTPDEDAALIDMQGPLLEQVEGTLGEPACYRRLRLLKRHRRDTDSVRL